MNALLACLTNKAVVSCGPESTARDDTHLTLFSTSACRQRCVQRIIIVHVMSRHPYPS